MTEGFDREQLARSALAAKRELRRRTLARIRGKLNAQEGRTLPESGPPDPRIPADIWHEIKERERRELRQ